MTILDKFYNEGKISERQYKAGVRYIEFWKGQKAATDPKMVKIAGRFAIEAFENDNPIYGEIVQWLVRDLSLVEFYLESVKEALDIIAGIFEEK